MRQRLHLIIFMAFIAICSMAQTIDEAFYVYRNDGQFNAFYRDEVISLEYSYEDANGTYYDEIVTQVVITTDSVYKIPLASIDSISFVKPQTIYKTDVVKMTSLLPYIISVDGHTLTLSSTTPASLLPRIGDVLICENDESTTLPNGFAGRVTQVNGSQVICNSVTFEDIFEELIAFEEYIADDNYTRYGSMPFARKKAGIDLSSSIKFKGTIGSVISGIADAKLSLKLRFLYRYSINKSAFCDISISPEFNTTLSIEGKGKCSMDLLENVIFEKTFPIYKGLFEVILKAGPMLELNCDASIKASTEAKLGFNAGLRYENGEFSGYTVNTSKWFSTPDLTGHINGSIYAGVKTSISFKSFGDIFSSDLVLKAGAEFSDNITMDIKDFDNYEDLQKAHIDFNAKASMEAKAKADISKWLKTSIELKLLNLKSEIDSWKLAPTFTVPEVTINSETSATVSVKPAGKVFGRVMVGLGVWKKNGELISTQYSTTSYHAPEDWNSPFKTTYYNLKGGTTYTAAPVVTLSGVEIKASPTKDFQTVQGENICPDDNHPHAIDLGLPSGTLWACCNVGAKSPEDHGGYFAWGEVQEKALYSDKTYQYGKYVQKGSTYHYYWDEIGSDIAGSSYDVAHVVWGDSWCMPQKSQYEELYYKTPSFKWVSVNGVLGLKIYGSNGNSIFFPASGHFTNKDDTSIHEHEEWCEYWSSSFRISTTSSYGSSYAYLFNAIYQRGDKGSYDNLGWRSNGYPVRPVCK